jgi:Icc-related predicted phosphoesterase
VSDKKDEINIAYFSDIHGVAKALPKISLPYDVILIGGDITDGADKKQAFDFMEGPFAKWLEDTPVKEIHATFGNHDIYIGSLKSFGKCQFHVNKSININGVDIFFTPNTLIASKRFNAFTKSSEDELYEEFKEIPDVHVIVSHGPPAGVLDKMNPNVSVGSHALARALNGKALSRGAWNEKLQLVLFGHVHEQGGRIETIERVHSLPLVFANGALLGAENQIRSTEPLEFCLTPSIKWDILR